MELTSNRVLLRKCPDYDERLSGAVSLLLESCRGSGTLGDSRVLLKPNLISARMGALACTEGRFILAAAQWFLDRGARVTVGDSPAFGTAESVLHKIGAAVPLRKMGCSLSNFDRVRHVTLSSGIRAGLAADALDCDLLVNMPRVKAHAQLRVTLAVKNLFGCLAGMRKPLWHMVYGGKGNVFADHLVELLPVLPPSVTLVDGVVVMHRTGPMTGEPFSLGIAASGTNPVAVDLALLSVLGIAPESCPLMRACIEKRLIGADPKALEYPLDNPAELAVDSFAVPDELSPIRFNPFRFARGSLQRILIRLGSRST